MKSLRCPNRSCQLLGKSWCWEHYPLWFLYNQVRETASIPVSDLREDVLPEHRYAIPSTPTSSRDLR